MDRLEIIAAWKAHPGVIELGKLEPEVSTETFFETLLGIPRDLRRAYIRAMSLDSSDVPGLGFCSLTMTHELDSLQ